MFLPCGAMAPQVDMDDIALDAKGYAICPLKEGIRRLLTVFHGAKAMYPFAIIVRETMEKILRYESELGHHLISSKYCIDIIEDFPCIGSVKSHTHMKMT